MELVSKVLTKLKRGKAADIFGLSAEHLIFSHPALFVVLARLFRLILLSGYRVYFSSPAFVKVRFYHLYYLV